jgi:hypothetical protein
VVRGLYGVRRYIYGMHMVLRIGYHARWGQYMAPWRFSLTCETLTEAERDMVMDFLQENNLQFGYDISSGGFYVLKLNSPAFSINQEEFNRKAQHILDTVVKPQVEKYKQLKLLEQMMAKDQEDGLYDGTL